MTALLIFFNDHKVPNKLNEIGPLILLFDRLEKARKNGEIVTVTKVNDNDNDIGTHQQIRFMREANRLAAESSGGYGVKGHYNVETGNIPLDRRTSSPDANLVIEMDNEKVDHEPITDWEP